MENTNKAPMENQSFWEKETFGRPYDLIVIGAGIVGLSSALFYRQRWPDARILVVDKGSIPEGASTRNAGFACVGSITEHVADMEKETEANIKKRLQRRYRGLHLLRETLGEEAIGYENCGGYEIFTEQEKFEEAESYIARFNSCMEELTGEKETYQPKQFEGYPVIYNRLEGAIDTGKMMQMLINRVLSAGIPINWNTRVQVIRDNGSLLLGDGRVLKTNQMLVATNGFTPRLLPELEIKPARGFVMVSEPWPDLPWKSTFNYDRGYIYFRNIGDRLLLGGGRNIALEAETLDDFGINKTIKTYLQNFARETLKMPEEIKFEYEWSGIMGFTPTKTPVLKRLDDHRVVAAGLSGMGISIGMDVGKSAAALLKDQ